jgi:AraC-like DNA-binding protein
MDALSNVLQVVRLSGSVFFTAEFSAPWALDSPNPELLASVVMPGAEHVVIFHILTQGECIIECDAHPAIRLAAGDAIVLPYGTPHTMRSDASARATPIRSVFSPGSRDALPRVAFGGGGKSSHFLCGYLNADQRLDHLVGVLPTMLVVRSRDQYAAIEAVDGGGWWPAAVPSGSGGWLRTTLDFAIQEARAGRPGNAAMLGRLTELMLVEIIREYVQQASVDRASWLGGLRDAHVGRALGLMHAEPARNWTVGALAREVALSRSVLAQRFRELVGEAPMHYLATWRMHVATQKLRNTSASLAQVAEIVGYDSEAAFSRAFKKAFGVAPATWRRSNS